jgi:hypothetical protein
MLKMWDTKPSSTGKEFDPGLNLDAGVICPLMEGSYTAVSANDFEVMLHRLERDCFIIVACVSPPRFRALAFLSDAGRTIARLALSMPASNKPARERTLHLLRQ